MTKRIPWLGPRWRLAVTAAAALGGAAFVVAVAAILTVAVGGLAYTLLNALWLAAVVSAVEDARFAVVFADGFATRSAVAVASILAGLGAGRLANHAPLALVGVAALLMLLTAEVRVARQ